MPLVPVVATVAGCISHMDTTVPVEPKAQCCPACRSPEQLRAVVLALDPVGNPRWAKRNTSGGPALETFCNKFAAAVARAMGVVLPDVWPGPDGWHELSANAMFDWLGKHGAGYGWAEVSAHQARAFAGVGSLVVAVWRNPAGSGHIAVILPSPEDGPLRIAQAGKTNLFAAPIAAGFGSLPVTFYAHP